MFKRTKRTLATLALTAFVGCSPIQPVTPTQFEAVTLHIHSDTASTSLLSTLSERYRDDSPDIQFQTASASHETVMQRLLDDDVPYVISSYLPRDDRLRAAPLAQDALALVTHPDTNISQISSSDVRRLYQGFITNWQQLNGADTPVTLYSRDSNSAVRANLDRLIMGRQRIASDAQILPSSDAVLADVAAQPGAIGYVPFSQIDPADSRVQVLAVDGVIPSLETIQNSVYPLRYTVYIIGQSEPQNAYRAFVGWVQSPRGQQVITPPYARLPQ